MTEKREVLLPEASCRWVIFAVGAMVLSSCSVIGSFVAELTAKPVGQHQIVDFSDVREAKGSGTWRNVFFLNFEGATVTADQSFIVRRAGLQNISIPKFSLADLGFVEGRRDEIISRITDIVAEVFAGYEISFTTTKPERGGFSAIHVGGNDFQPGRQVLGLAPLDIDNFSSRDTGFAFSKNISPRDPERAITVLSAVIAHEIAHCLGARHIAHQFALMNPTVGSDNLQLVNAPLVGGAGLEDTAELIRRNIGLAEHGNDTALAVAPDLVRLSYFAQKNVRQYTVYTPANIAVNPDKNLGLYRYRWQIGDREIEGSNIRIPESQLTDAISISIDDSTGTKTFLFDQEGSLKL